MREQGLALPEEYLILQDTNFDQAHPQYVIHNPTGGQATLKTFGTGGTAESKAVG